MGWIRTISQNEIWRGHLLGFVAIVSAMALLSMAGALAPINDSFTDLRFSLLKQPSSGETVIVAIDTKSLQQYPDWPWARSYHGRLVEALDAAGAKAIAFDVDFSSPGEAAQTQMFADAIERAKAPVYLATFQQSLSEDMPDIIAEILPTPALLEAGQLASVNYTPEPSGLVRYAENGREFSFGIVPSFATALTGGEANTQRYLVNFSIDVSTIPQISYVDILSGNFDTSSIEGKTVFVGASAVELGDEYALPAYGVRSGVALNAIAFDSVSRNAQLSVLPAWLSWGGAALIIMGLGAIYRSSTMQGYVCALAIGFSLVFATSLLLLHTFYLVLLTAEIFGAMILATIYVAYLELQKRNLKLFRARMEIRQNYALLDALISENHEGVLTINHQNIVQLCNERAANLLGVARQDILGKPLMEVRPDLVADIDLSGNEEGMLGNFQIETQTAEEGGTHIDVTVSRVKIDPQSSQYERRTETRRTTLFALHDITAQKHAEHTERAAKEALAETVMAKSQLISTMSHELRTPLNAIIGFSKIYQDQLFGPLGADEYGEYAALINTSGHQLLAVVNDMLLAGKIQSNELKLHPDMVNPRDAFEAAEAVARGKHSWGEQEVLQEFDRDVRAVKIDHETMQVALVHLIDNAAKFSGAQGAIELKTYAQDDEFIFEVSDNGPGAEGADLEELTGMLRQGDSSHNRQHEGCGMGLFIVKSIAELHGGRLVLGSSSAGFTAQIRLADVIHRKKTPIAA